MAFLGLAVPAQAQGVFIAMPALESDFDAKRLPELQRLREQIRALTQSLNREKATKANKASRDERLKDLEAARNRLTDLAVEYVAEIEMAESVVRVDVSQALADRYKQSFFDTVWRLGQRAKGGDARAQATLGALHRLGVVAERDDAKACAFYRSAAERMHVAALYHAASCPGEAKGNYIERAAAGGHPAAQEMLGRTCLNERRDPACALDWLARAGEQRRPSALSLLGYMYATGDLVPKDEKRAFAFLLGAARLGNAAAQNNVGQMLELGLGTAPDPKEAFGWYKRSAEAGIGPAQVNLARCYIEGRGTAKNEETAKQWLGQAQKQGVKEASVLLEWLSSRGAPQQAR
jgi:TPR repeat protein